MQHPEIEVRESGGVEHWPGGEDRTAAKDQPRLVALPHRPHGINDDATLDVRTRHSGQKNCNTEVKAVHYGKADQQDAEQCPLDGFIVKHGELRLFGEREDKGVSAAVAGACAIDPALTVFSIR